MRDSIEIPEDLPLTDTMKQKKSRNYDPPIDNSIDEEIPITESQEFRRGTNLLFLAFKDHLFLF